MSLPINQGQWKIDPTHSSVAFTIKHLGISKVRGQFNAFDASATVGETLDASSLSAEIDMASVDTNNEDRDNHLKSTDFFGVEANPKMTFSSSAITQAGEEYKVAGDLTINGQTKPIELKVEFEGQQVNPQSQSTHAGFSATGIIKRSDYGIDFNMPLGADKMLISDDVKIELDVQLVES